MQPKLPLKIRLGYDVVEKCDDFVVSSCYVAVFPAETWSYFATRLENHQEVSFTETQDEQSLTGRLARAIDTSIIHELNGLYSVLCNQKVLERLDTCCQLSICLHHHSFFSISMMMLWQLLPHVSASSSVAAIRIFFVGPPLPTSSACTFL